LPFSRSTTSKSSTLEGGSNPSRDVGGVKGRVPVYLEVTSKRTFAGAVEWPGWCRAGRTVEAALEALVAHADRYGKVVSPSRLGFEPPSRV
jgi:hypothetical protein